jgi:uncharacterized membrane protein
MNQAHLHLVFNHLPIIIPIIGLLVLIGGFIFRSEIIKRTAFCIFILGALCTIPAIATGDGAEEVVENLQGVSEQMIKEHEEIAETFAVLSYLLGIISLVALWANWKQKTFANLLAFLIMAFSIVVLFFAKQTGTTGGEIRHTEIRNNNNNIEKDREEKDDKD